MKLFLNLFLLCIILGGVDSMVLAQNGLRKGVVQVKLTPEADRQLQYSATPLTAVAGQLTVGIKSLDAANIRYNAYSMRRLFKIGGKYEKRQRDFGLHLWYEIEMDETVNVKSVAKDYLELDEISQASPVYTIRQMDCKSVVDSHDKLADVHPTPLSTYSNDPLLYRQWHYNNPGTVTNSVAGADIRLADAWDITMGKQDIIVSIHDHGVDYGHEDLVANMWINKVELNGLPGVDDDGNGYIDDIYGYNFVSGAPDVTFANGHGTHVAGTVGAVNNNSIGVAGVAGGSGNNDGVRLMSCQILEQGKSGTRATIHDSYVYAADNGAVISQNSWGYTEPNGYNQPDIDGINYFIQYAGKDEYNNPLPNTPMVGGIVIFAAGNDNMNALWYPAAFPQAISVASLAPNGRKAYYSNYADWVTITAPGGVTDVTGRGVYSTLPNNTYGYLQGTSMACPHVSGIAALVLSKYGHNNYTPDSLRTRLLHEPIPIGQWEPDYAQYMGVGLINAKSALAPYTRVQQIAIPTTATVELNKTTSLTVTYTPADAFDKQVIWSSEDPAIATVDSKGGILGIKDGITRIKAVSNDNPTTEAYSTVTVIRIPVASVAVVPETITIAKGTNTRLTATVNPSNASDQSIIWNSLDPNIATSNNVGYIQALSVGLARIEVTTVDGGLKDTSYITVVQPVTGVDIVPTYPMQVMVDNTILLSVIVTPTDASNKNVTWQSNNISVATVDANGLVTGVNGGDKDSPKVATIKVTTEDGGFSATANVFVYDAAQAPQGFSPNGDGVNDYFVITLDSRDTYTLRVFDKSGQVHYQSTDYRNDWEGTANAGPNTGAKVRSGTYFYTLVTNKTGSAVSGYVVIKY